MEGRRTDDDGPRSGWQSLTIAMHNRVGAYEFTLGPPAGLLARSRRAGSGRLWAHRCVRTHKREEEEVVVVGGEG